MTEIPSEADIHCPAEKIFDVIIDFRGPDRWLTKSSAFRGASKISSNPVTLGTTYCEPGPFGARNGEGLQGAAGHLRVVQAGQRQGVTLRPAQPAGRPGGGGQPRSP